MEKLPEEFNMTEIMGKVEERTPYVIVAFQECERMNYLTGEIKRSLRELDLGLKGELTITSDMEDLENSLFLDQVPTVWTQRAYPSLLGLTPWFVDLLLRLRELETWSTDFVVSNLTKSNDEAFAKYTQQNIISILFKKKNNNNSIFKRKKTVKFSVAIVSVVGRIFQPSIVINSNHAVDSQKA